MPKIPISVTVEKKYVEWVDRQIDSLRFRNRSHAVEYALAKPIENEKKEQIIWRNHTHLCTLPRKPRSEQTFYSTKKHLKQPKK